MPMLVLLCRVPRDSLPQQDVLGSHLRHRTEQLPILESLCLLCLACGHLSAREDERTALFRLLDRVASGRVVWWCVVCLVKAYRLALVVYR